MNKLIFVKIVKLMSNFAKNLKKFKIFEGNLRGLANIYN